MSLCSGASRYHCLDSLRGHMMILGIAIHAMAAYFALPPELEFWDIRDRQPSALLNVVGLFLHSFRLQLFFVLAGFFAAMLIERRGIQTFFRNRVHRIVVPLAVSWLLCYPLIMVGFAYGRAITQDLPDPWQVGLNALQPGAINREGPLSHLWFLYYLLYYYLGSYALLWLSRRLPQRWKTRATHLFRRSLTARTRWLLLCVPAAAALMLLPNGVIGASTQWMPHWQIMLGYGVFFYFGWFLYGQRDLLLTFQRGAWTMVLMTPLIVLIQYVFAMPRLLEATRTGQFDPILQLIMAFTNALLPCLMVFGLIGLYLRYLDRESATGRYLADASYWMYLVHMPLVIWLQAFLADVPIPGLIKFGLVFGSVTALALITYDLLVRSTFIGAVLNGRRMPRALVRPRCAPLRSESRA
jgi:glucan biosynthesis protein C